MGTRGFFQKPICNSDSRYTDPILIASIIGLLAGMMNSGPLLAADLTTPEAQEQLDRSLTEQGVNYTVMHEGLDSQRIIMNSSSNLQALRKALYSLPVQQAFLRDSTTITLSGRVPKNKTVEVVLESNLATGYSWELANSANNILTQEGSSVYESRGLLGGNTKQTMRIKAIKEGNTETNLVYKRPWQQNSSAVQAMAASAPNKITIQLDVIPDVIDLSNPDTTVANMPEEGHKQLYRPSTDSLLPMATLPAAFDWRTSGAVTPVRDQGNCGGCWAFATVGALEFAFKVKMGTDINASEQFLVSCNNDGYSCNGGWFAHNYHANTLGKLQTAAGAVVETDIPYIASNGSCKAVSSHPNRISSWSYIAGYTVPSVDQIKNAIYTYGSVATAVCVGPAFQAYRSGVFSTDESAACGSSKVNHAIVLIGWDDATQTWVLRNSWGSSWAEQGYMRIKYGTSNVGYSANYVVLASDKANQTISAISFSPATVTVSGTTTASATASSGLAVSFSSKTPTVCTVGGSTVKGVTAGACTIAADQAGNTTYNAASQVSQTLTVSVQSYTLVVNKAGTGSGTVVSSPAGINCGATCSTKFNNGTSINLTATTASGSAFAGWNNKGCTGTPATCTVIATFNLVAKTKTTASTEGEAILSPSIVITPELVQ